MFLGNATQDGKRLEDSKIASKTLHNFVVENSIKFLELFTSQFSYAQIACTPSSQY